MVRMWKRHLRVSCAAPLAGVLWAACSGDPYVDVEEPPPCESTTECDPERTGTECIDGRCQCPNPEEEKICCKPGAKEELGDDCERACRPIAECDAALCETPRDCAGPVDARCGEAVCIAGVCRLALPEQLQNQRPGDCVTLRCDEAGRVVEEPDDSDVFNDGNECTVDTCASGVGVHHPREAGRAEESAGRCDGERNLVECLTDDDCGNPSSVACSQHGWCVPQWCVDGDFDAPFGETATDCGGACDPCTAGQACLTLEDCQDQVCTEERKCALPTCSDRVRNGVETDVDCGAPSCPACDPGKRCNSHESCKSGVCVDGVCRAAICGDGFMNGDEAGIDCGGPCVACPLYIDYVDI
ncbi:uncharacterized protein SOCE26_065470 [Sorangium cellulosum]|uniref:Tryptophan synthase alpha chain n=2 Tax=Sorangium cellulosum TaxID=56 RepID=A0A2L0F0L5_SORCE|nr:uncharacterized protein SOCE26_065470 [Sorangium cellulosum]